MTDPKTAELLAALEADTTFEAGAQFLKIASDYFQRTRSGEGPVSTKLDKRTIAARFPFRCSKITSSTNVSRFSVQVRICSRIGQDESPTARPRPLPLQRSCEAGPETAHLRLASGISSRRIPRWLANLRT